MLRRPALRALALLAVALGCATDWQPAGSYARSAQTRLEIASTPPATVFVDGRPAGTTPVSIPLDYDATVEKQRRKVSYWQAEPAIATFLTFASFGLYAPFGAIPVSEEESAQPTGRYERNRFRVELRAPGHVPWVREIEAAGEPTLQIHAELTPEPGSGPSSRSR